jgi:hypothetical protein
LIEPVVDEGGFHVLLDAEAFHAFGEFGFDFEAGHGVV